ncbi:collagen alpha-1(I) chain-like [Vulpes lagopus]|uniref:collagen alpha-1(I) chain-like n=1 Tax=Vulpes lagopus TaxID=494514 RepID=UPI001BC942AC|nr:collagen alpha-1(I) chain-like [Vulpes lagopus]
MVGGGVAGAREGQGRGEAPPPPPPGGRHFVSVGSLRGLRFLLPRPAPGARRRTSLSHSRPVRAGGGGGGGVVRRSSCATRPPRPALTPRRAGWGSGSSRPAAGPGRAGAGAAAVHGGAAAPWLPLSGVVQKASYLRPKNLPRLLSMPSAAARPGGAALPRSGFSAGALAGVGRPRPALPAGAPRRGSGAAGPRGGRGASKVAEDAGGPGAGPGAVGAPRRPAEPAAPTAAAPPPCAPLPPPDARPGPEERCATWGGPPGHLPGHTCRARTAPQRRGAAPALPPAPQPTAPGRPPRPLPGHYVDLVARARPPLHLEATTRAHISRRGPSAGAAIAVLYPARVPNRPSTLQAPPTTLLPVTRSDWAQTYSLQPQGVRRPRRISCPPRSRDEHERLPLSHLKSSRPPRPARASPAIPSARNAPSQPSTPAPTSPQKRNLLASRGSRGPRACPPRRAHPSISACFNCLVHSALPPPLLDRDLLSDLICKLDSPAPAPFSLHK